MSANEILVAVVFVLLGYWIVSAFLNRKPKPPAEEPPASRRFEPD
jgi:hypothetical protein